MRIEEKGDRELVDATKCRSIQHTVIIFPVSGAERGAERGARLASSLPDEPRPGLGPRGTAQPAAHGSLWRGG